MEHTLARIHVCWPRQTVRNRPSRAPLHPWAWPEDPGSESMWTLRDLSWDTCF